MSDIEHIGDGQVYTSKDKHQMDDEANMNYSEAFIKYPSTNDGDIESEDDDETSVDGEPAFDDSGLDDDVEGADEGSDTEGGGVESI